METCKQAVPKAGRLVSLDVLRGIDIFLLLFLSVSGSIQSGPIAALDPVPAWCQEFVHQFNHSSWLGFTVCDLIMPLFLFMTGAAIPFSLARYIGPNGQKKEAALWWRILRRVALLWVLGMVIQGNLLELNLSHLKLYSNTLQAIAAGYLISSLIYLFVPRCCQFLVFLGLLFAFWSSCTWLHFGTWGAGSFSPSTNLAYGIDQTLLGHWRNCTATGPDGQVIFEEGYQYTWILSSLTFGATTLSGLLAGELLRNVRVKNAIPDMSPATRRRNQWKAFALLLVAGIVSTALALLWNAIPEGTFGYCPIIKIIWTPSMVLFSSGLSLILLAMCYLIYDLFERTWFKTFFIVMGMNAITAYILSHVLHFEQVADWFLYGLAQWTGPWQGVVVSVGGMAILWYILWAMYRCGKFVRL